MMNLNPVRLIRAFRSHVENLDRGAALVEAAIAIPLLLMVIMGSVEFGFAWEAKSSSTSGVRTGIIRAATIGDKPETDMRVIQSIIGEVGADNVDRLGWIVVFDASGPNDQDVVDQCVAGGGGTCVYYDATFIQDVANTTDAAGFQTANFDVGLGGQPDGSYICDGKIDNAFCAGKRSEFDSDIEVGVAIRYNHEWFTGILPFAPPSFEDLTVTSTFQSNGASISPSGVSVPSQIGQVVNTGFNAGVDPDTATSDWSVGADKAVAVPNNSSNGVLGRFNNDTVTLAVSSLDDHKQVCVSFTLHLIDSWDTNDTFTFEFAGSPPVEITIGSTGVTNSAETGFNSKKAWSDRTVPVSKCFDHEGDTANMSFSAAGLQAMNDESWAIDDVTVTIRN